MSAAMPINSYEPPKEVNSEWAGSKRAIAIGCAAATAMVWPCLMLTVLAILPEPVIGPAEDRAWAMRAELQTRFVLSAGVSLPLAMIGSLLVMFVGNRTR